MATPREELPARPSPVGLATVDRYLPGARRRLIGPWCFLDRFGGESGDPGVGPHPHIGIQTAMGAPMREPITTPTSTHS